MRLVAAALAATPPTAWSVLRRTPPPRGAALHANVQPTCYLLTRGSVRIDHGTTATVLNAGRCYLMPPGVRYRFASPTGGAATVYAIFPDHGTIWLNQLPDFVGPRHRWRSTIGLPTPAAGALRELLLAAISLAEIGDGAEFPAVVAVVIRLLDRALRTVPPRSSRGGVEPLRRARRLLAERCADPELSVASLAEAAGVHPDTLTRRFRAAEGMGVREAIDAARLQLACDLLADRSLPIAEVARRSGFRHPSRLSHAFRRVYGVQPSQYRRFGHVGSDETRR